MKSQDLIQNIKSRYDSLSKGQKRIADYIIDHYYRAAYMTATKLGNECDVSESTVVRFATELGFEGYPQLQTKLQDNIRTKLTTMQRIETIGEKIGDDGDTLSTVLTSDIYKIKKTLEEIDRDEFNNAIEAVLDAKKIYILGVRSSAAIASFLGFYLNLLFDNVRLVHTTSVSEMFEQILRTGKGDVVIGISFPRYSRRTVKALQYAHERGSTVIGITDSVNSPIKKYSDYAMIAKSDMVSFVDSLVAPLSVVNAFIVALGMRKKNEVSKMFAELETIWHEYEVYEPYDNDLDDLDEE